MSEEDVLLNTNTISENKTNNIRRNVVIALLGIFAVSVALLAVVAYTGNLGPEGHKNIKNDQCFSDDLTPGNLGPCSVVSGYVFSNDSKPIYYTMVSPPNGKVAKDVNGDPLAPLVLIPGFPYRNTEWFCQIKKFCLTQVVVAYDARGHGSSTKFGPFTMAQHAEDAAAIINTLNLDQATVVGHSLGGGIATSLALYHPDLLDKLVLVDTTAKVINLDGWTSGIDPATINALASLLPNTTNFFNAFLSASFIQVANCPADPLQGFIDASRDSAISAGMNASVIGGIFGDAIATWDFRANLASITSRTLIIHGHYDNIFPFSAALYARANIPDSYLVEISSVGHVTPLLNWPEVNRAICRFVSGADTLCTYCSVPPTYLSY